MASPTAQDQSHGDVEQNVYSFTLVLDGVSTITEQVEAAIYKAGCDDGLLGMEDGQAYIAFDREADSMMQAIFSAIHDVEACGLDVRVIQVVPPGQQAISLVNAMLRIRQEQPALLNSEALKGLGKLP